LAIDPWLPTDDCFIAGGPESMTYSPDRDDLGRRSAAADASAVLLRNATPSVLHQRHIGRVLRPSSNPGRRRLAPSRGRAPQSGRCPSLWPGDLRNDGISVAAAVADGSET